MLKGTSEDAQDAQVHETKIVRLTDSETGTRYAYMITMIDNKEKYHEPLAGEGYYGTHMIFTLLSGPELASGKDPYNPPLRDDLNRDFLIELRDGDIDWGDIEDGDVYTAQDIEALKNGEEQDQA